MQKISYEDNVIKHYDKEIHGIAEKVFSRGKLAYEFDGDKFHVEKGHGKFCPRNDFDQKTPFTA